MGTAGILVLLFAGLRLSLAMIVVLVRVCFLVFLAPIGLAAAFGARQVRPPGPGRGKVKHPPSFLQDVTALVLAFQGRTPSAPIGKDGAPTGEVSRDQQVVEDQLIRMGFSRKTAKQSASVAARELGPGADLAKLLKRAIQLSA